MTNSYQNSVIQNIRMTVYYYQTDDSPASNGLGSLYGCLFYAPTGESEAL